VTATITLEDANAELTLRLRQQQLAAEFANFGLQTDELRPVLDEACRVAAKGMECSFAKLLEHLPAEDSFLVRAGVGWRPGVVGYARLGGGPASPAGHAFDTGQPVLSNRLSADTRFRTPTLLIEHGVQSASNVLVRTPGQHYGVLEVDSTERDAFTLADTAFLENLAATLANAIAKQRRLDELRQSKSFIEGVLAASPDCVKVLDADGRLESINDNGRCLLEIDDLAQVAGQPWVNLWPEDQREKVRAALAAARAGGIGRFDGFCPTGRGTPKWWDVLVSPLADTETAARKLVSISRDISDRVAAIEAKDLLLLEVHHRVKNSLQLVHNLLSLQGRASEDEHAREQLFESAARVRTIAAIHDRLYRTGSDLFVEVGPYLEGLVEDLRTGMASTLGDRPLRVSVEAVTWPAGAIPTLGLVVTELVTNALKYGAGTVSVTFRQPPGGNAVLTVRDGGRDLPGDFDPARSRGLGMRLVTGLLRGEGAGLEIDRSEGHTCFIARLPAERAHPR